MSIINEVDTADRVTRSADVKVWDIAVRLFHWSLLAAFVLAWVSAEEWDRFHEITGYIVGGLIAFRIIWGLIGTNYARFSNFLYRPTTVVQYLRDSLTGRAKRFIGHNPAGGAMVIALLLSLVGITASGIAMTSNMFWGVEWVGEVHEALVSFTLVLVILHVAGVIYAGFEHKENLVKAMITGFKRRSTD